MSYIGNTPGVSSQRIVDTFISTAGQTTFTTTSGYTPGYVDVYYNGVKLVAGDDFTAATGTTIVLASGAALGDSVEIVAYLPRGLSDGYLKSEADAKYLTIANPSYTGTLTGGTGVVNLGSGQLYKDASGHLLLGATSVSNTPGWDKLLQINATNYPALSLKSSFRQWDLTTYGSSGALLFYDTTAGAERARFDSSGQFGIGATNPGAPLHIYSGTQEQIRLGRNATGSSGYITFFANNSSSVQVQYAGILGDVSSSTAGSHAGNLLFYVTNAGTSAERARIDSNGRLLVGTTYTPSNFPTKGTAVSGGVLHYHECSFGGATKVVTFSGDFNYFCELTITVWGNASSGIYQGRFLAGRRDWTGANHQTNYADLVGSQLDYSLSTSDSGNTRTFTVTFNQANDSANLHWSIEAKVRNLLSFSIS